MKRYISHRDTITHDNEKHSGVRARPPTPHQSKCYLALLRTSNDTIQTLRLNFSPDTS